MSDHYLPRAFEYTMEKVDDEFAKESMRNEELVLDTTKQREKSN